MVRLGSGIVVRGIRALLLSSGLAFAGNACIGQVCTLIDCSNAAYIDIGRAGAWQDGSYALDISMEDEQRSCNFAVPDDLPAAGLLAMLDCGEGVFALLGQRQNCTSTTSNDGNSASGSCTPIPDEYELTLELTGNPKTISITLARDGTTLLSDSRTPKYERDYPNGPDCDEGCSQASYPLSFED